MLLFGFGDTGIDLEEYDVVSAKLYFAVDDCFALGTSLSLGVYGINADDSSWVDGTENGATWSGKSGAATGWAEGATFGASLQSTGLFYGNRSVTVNDTDLDTTWYNVDITAAFRDMINGVSGGIALASFTNGSTFEGSDTALQIYSDGAGSDLSAFKPGLRVETMKLPAPVTITAVPAKSIKLAATGVLTGAIVTWTREGSGSIADAKGRYAGAATSTLTISALKAADAGIYRATSEGTSGALIQRFRLVLLTQPPVLETPEFPHGQMATAYSYELKALPGAHRAPSGFTATGLPTGLVMDRNTGKISGEPRAAGTFKVSVQAFHAGAKSAVVKTTLVIHAMPPGIAGVWVSIVPRSSVLTQPLGLGGRLDLTVTTSGRITGSLTNGLARHGLSGAVTLPSKDGIPVASITVARKGLTSLALQLQFGQPSTDLLTGVLTLPASGETPTEELAITGWRSVWVMKATATLVQRLPSAFTGRLHTLLDIPANLVGDLATPQGTGHAVLTVTSNGVVTLSNAMTGAGTRITGTCTVGPQGQVAVHQALPAATGSVLGTLHITPATENPAQPVSGTLSLAKRPAAPLAKDRTYSNGYGPLLLTAEGGRYTVPATGSIILDLTASANNAHLRFFEGNISREGTSLTATPPDILVTIAKPAAVSVPTRGKTGNLAFTSLSISATTGVISGSFILADIDTVSTKAVKPVLKRTVPYQGLIIPRPGKPPLGVGWFLCPALPAHAGQTTATTPILAGQMLLEQASPTP